MLLLPDFKNAGKEVKKKQKGRKSEKEEEHKQRKRDLSRKG